MSQPDSAGEASAVRAAESCLDEFTACFNARDAQGMDRHLHFPHVMLSGPQVTVWRHAGQLAGDFFEKLAASGWARSTYEAREPILATPDKVHFLVRYSRRSADGAALSVHENVWIVTRVDGRWGIAVRSY